jgi:hypothetical protein
MGEERTSLRDVRARRRRWREGMLARGIGENMYKKRIEN